MRKYRIIVSEEAREDIREARKWYNIRQSGLGKRLNADMHRTLRSISNNPWSFHDNRLANFDTFPYAAHFFISDERATVYVTAFMHTSRHPDTAKDRR